MKVIYLHKGMAHKLSWVLVIASNLLFLKFDFNVSLELKIAFKGLDAYFFKHQSRADVMSREGTENQKT